MSYKDHLEMAQALVPDVNRYFTGMQSEHYTLVLKGFVLKKPDVSAARRLKTNIEASIKNGEIGCYGPKLIVTALEGLIEGFVDQ